MNGELFDIVFFGILQPGKDKEAVMQNMAKLFKTEPARLAPYFAGGRKVIKGNVDAATADKYQAALENVGLVIKLEPAGAAQPASPPPAQGSGTDTATDAQAADTAAGMSVAPVGTDVLENSPEVVPQEIEDISGITMAEAGADVIENPVQVPAQPIGDISDLSMAEAGSDVLEHHEEVEPQPIGDISDLSIAEVGVDLVENPEPKKAAPVPDTSELSLED